MKFYNKTVIARNAAAPYLFLAEHISVHKETQQKVYEKVKEKLDEIERPKRREKYLLERERKRRVFTHSLTKSEQDRINEEHEQCLWALEQASKLIMETKACKHLENWNSNPVPSLLSRLGPPQCLTHEGLEKRYRDIDNI